VWLSANNVKTFRTKQNWSKETRTVHNLGETWTKVSYRSPLTQSWIDPSSLNEEFYLHLAYNPPSVANKNTSPPGPVDQERTALNRVKSIGIGKRGRGISNLINGVYELKKTPGTDGMWRTTRRRLRILWSIPTCRRRMVESLKTRGGGGGGKMVWRWSDGIGFRDKTNYKRILFRMRWSVTTQGAKLEVRKKNEPTRTSIFWKDMECGLTKSDIWWS